MEEAEALEALDVDEAAEEVFAGLEVVAAATVVVVALEEVPLDTTEVEVEAFVEVREEVLVVVARVVVWWCGLAWAGVNLGKREMINENDRVIFVVL